MPAKKTTEVKKVGGRAVALKKAGVRGEASTDPVPRGVASGKAGARGDASARRAEVADEICERIAQGRPLAAICREEGMPSRQTVHHWREEDKDFAVRYARAREDGFEAIAHRLREIARGTGESSGDLPRDKLIIDTDLKLLSKWAPKHYGDKIDVSANHGGEIKIVMGGDVG